jgi:ComF family protein
MRRWLDSLLELVAPSRCAACDAVSRATWCAGCGQPSAAFLGTLPDSSLPLRAGGVYAGSLAQAIRRFKYEPRPELARTLAAWLAPRLGPLQGSGCVWVPVPLHPSRLAERGFNQSALLGRRLAALLGGRVAPQLLARQRDTAQQAVLAAPERAHNLRASMRVQGVASEPILLVDDVVTSGATARACADALHDAGLCVRGVVALAATQRTERTAARNGAGATKSV